MKCLDMLAHGVGSGITKTPEFVAFARQFRADLKSHLTKSGAKITKFNINHFYISGFYRNKNGNCIYFSLPDVRGYDSMEMAYKLEMLVRTAKGEKDYTGGANNYIRVRCLESPLLNEVEVRFIKSGTYEG